MEFVGSESNLGCCQLIILCNIITLHTFLSFFWHLTSYYIITAVIMKLVVIVNVNKATLNYANDCLHHCSVCLYTE